MPKLSDSIRTYDWDASLPGGDQGCHTLLNSDVIAGANRLEGHSTFAIEANSNLYLAHKRNASAVVSSLSLEDLVTILENIPKVRSILGARGIKTLSLNTLNAANDPGVLARAITLNCRIRFEFLLDVTQYSLAQISSNHKRNIKKSNRLDSTLRLPADIAAMRRHIELVNTNLDIKGVGGITNSPEYFLYLIKKNAGLLMQVTENEELLASTFFIKNQDYAYYHSSGTSDRGKQTGAAYFLVNSMIAEMRERQMRYLNLGGCTSEQTGLCRFKIGFRPETRVLVSARRQLIRSGKQRVRSLLSIRPEDILNVDKVKVYTKSASALSTVDFQGYSIKKITFDALFEAVARNPELSQCLEIFCRSSLNCYALFGKQEQILAMAFVETGEGGGRSDANRHSLPPDVAEITHVQVINAMRARGIGRLLVNLLEQEISTSGFSKVYSRLAAENIAAQRMVLAAGFTLAGEEKRISTAIMGGGSRIVGRIDV